MFKSNKQVFNKKICQHIYFSTLIMQTPPKTVKLSLVMTTNAVFKNFLYNMKVSFIYIEF